ncbi:glycosyltransferase [Lentilactobacillus curieae]|uniref:Glycosyltransferase n=1 Tax=Lentilactobacillus curieae TaxID=1138822 RepID=A0A1S6QH02_9LACO|nr:glycosyltransferase family 2 protein [Lentilactobacillus curieae]AQW20888.1 glycosyltransferase [Lentilactobacillus curieae]
MVEKADLVSIVLPVFNEEELIATTINKLEKYVETRNERFELIFVNDGSSDRTVQIIKHHASRKPNIKLVNFSRNFGHQLAITAGIRYTSGSAVVVMDADLQDSPEIISKMISMWQQGYDVVYGQRVARAGESKFKKFTAATFYRLLDRITSIEIPVDTGDFRLMDRKVVDVLTSMDEPEPFVRGMVSWVGFKQAAVRYERQERIAGETKYPLKKMFKLAMDGITSFSNFPLKLISIIGSGLFGIGVALILGCLIFSFSDVDILASVVVAMAGAVITSVGVLGSYIYRTFVASRKRPLYVVESAVGFTETVSQPNSARTGSVVRFKVANRDSQSNPT